MSMTLKNKILLNKDIRYVGLGDRLDVLGIAKIMHQESAKRVKILQPNGHFRQFDELIEMFSFPCFYYHGVPVEGENYFCHNPDGNEHVEFYENRDFYRFDTKSWYMPELGLPPKYVTAQFDGTQNRNYLRRPKKILDEYREKGYEIVMVGGQATIPQLQPKPGNLKNISNVMSRSQGHVGVDSGMMHLAKFSMPVSKIEICVLNSQKTNFVKVLESKGAKIRDVL